MTRFTRTTRLFGPGLCATALLTLSACSDDGPAGAGGPGEVDPAPISTEDELVDMIGGETVCGDGGLDLHRGHAPVQSTLEEILGISHDEMHVYLEEDGMNLAAVAEEVGVERDSLDEQLTDHLTPAIDGLVEDGTITEDQAAAYRDDLAAALDFRIDWDGEQEPLDLCTAST